jgi:uncharacterized membrane protein
MRRLRRYLLEGLALVVPVGATAWILLWLFRRLDGILGPYLDPVLGRSAPGLGILALLAVAGGHRVVGGAHPGTAGHPR